MIRQEVFQRAETQRARERRRAVARKCLWCGEELLQRYLFCDELCSMMARAKKFDVYLDLKRREERRDRKRGAGSPLELVEFPGCPVE